MRFTVKPYTDFSLDEILPVYESAGWTNYTERPELLAGAYRNSLNCLAAYKGEKLVGVLRAVGDGYSIVFIQDLLVLPAYQRQGAGTALVHALLESYPDVYQIELATDCEPRTIGFYRALGFSELSELGCTGFIRMKV